MILTIAHIPNPVLKKLSTPVKEITPVTAQLIHDLVDTLHAHTNCVGIAAPQVSKNICLIIVDVSRYPKPHPNHGQMILINPIISSAEGRITGREGCLSVPDFTGIVTRFEKVVVEALDEKWQRISIHSEGFEAVVLQHEIDHLQGKVFLDQVSSLKTDVFRRKNYIDKPV